MHVLTVAAPGVLEYFPDAQPSHSELATVLENLPAGQSTHAEGDIAAICVENLPTPQVSQLDEAVLEENFP